MSSLKIKDVYPRVQNNLKLGVRGIEYYLKEDGNWKQISKRDLAILIRSLFTQEEQACISTSCVKEIIERLAEIPALQLCFVEDLQENYVKLRQGIFNTETGRLEEFVHGDFGYFYDFDYVTQSERSHPVFTDFIKSIFPEETEIKKQFLLEVMGYILSDYHNAKAAFFLIGESNSGKSTILELLRRIFPESCVTCLPLERLSNRFNLARLCNSRVNISFELSENSFKTSSILKMFASNEVVTAEHKGKDPFEFRMKCKSINAGNCIPKIKPNEGTDALINRMKILYFPVSIERSQQDLNLIDKLWKERDSIFSEALDTLVELRTKNFTFVEPSDSQQLKNQLLIQGNIITNFISDCCCINENSREHLVSLYDALKVYCTNNLFETLPSQNEFRQFLCKLQGVRHGKFRIQGSQPLSGVIGLKLKISMEYDLQDSEKYSPKSKRKLAIWNAGTAEQGKQEEQENGR